MTRFCLRFHVRCNNLAVALSAFEEHLTVLLPLDNTKSTCLFAVRCVYIALLGSIQAPSLLSRQMLIA
jgi:hypothetical protein